MDDYLKWRQEMADRRKACLACEFDSWAAQASAEELEAAQPCADSHGGKYCTRTLVEIRHITVEDAVRGLEKIHRDFQNNNDTNDKWDWLHADFYLECIKSHLKKTCLSRARITQGLSSSELITQADRDTKETEKK